MNDRMRAIRYGLAAIGVLTLANGVWALLAPAAFYQSFPWPGRNWVSMLPSYNEHLLRDFGGLNLGFAFLLLLAAVKLDRLLTGAVLVGYLGFAVPHLVFHLFHLAGFPLVDVLGQVVSLAVLVAGPAVLLALNYRTPARPGWDPGGTDAPRGASDPA